MTEQPPLSRAFVVRRRMNWIPLGIMYGGYYTCRYNLSVANKSIADEFGFSNQQMGYLFSAQYFAYAVGQLVNGLITDARYAPHEIQEIAFAKGLIPYIPADRE